MKLSTLQVLLVAALCTTTGCPAKPPPPADAGIDWKAQAPFSVPADQLAGSSLVACPTLDTTRCQAGTLQRCAIMDTATQAPAASPDPLLKRVLTFERWYELYHSPDGQTVERHFNQPVDAGTPESEWGSAARFATYGGLRDSALWTGVALNGLVMRYLVTGSAADYQRMEDKTRAQLLQFEVTGIPGYLARYHFEHLPAGAPPIDTHLTQYEPGDVDPADGGLPNGNYHLIENPSAVVGLPPAYLTGLTDADGGVWPGTPMWDGNPSIDQYTGPMIAFPAVWGLLKDQGLKDRIALQLTCYLKRLQRLEIKNIQRSPDVLHVMQSLLGTGTDIDLSTINSLVVYYLPQYNVKSAATFDKSCPATITRTAGRVLDAASSNFEGDLLMLVGDLSSGAVPRANGIDHYYIPNVRGADAVHLMNLAAMGTLFTGDPLYQQFMDEVLLSALDTTTVASTISLGKPNKWCRKFYDSHISVPPLWALTNVLGPSTLRTKMEAVLWNNAWLQDGALLNNAKLGLMAASHPPPDTDVSQAVSMSLREIEHLGGNGGMLLDPRRTWSVPFSAVTAAGVTPVCPTEAERTACEQGPTLFGIQLQGTKITHPCTGAADECPMSGGVCATVMAAAPVPVELRQWEDFEWQRSPYQMGVTFTPEGQRQSPGLDLIEEYWLARYYGMTAAGQGQALAWHDEGACP